MSTLDLVGTALGVVLAHAVTGLPYVVLTVSAALSNLDPRLEQAARGLGASLGQTLRYVIVPNIVPGVLSGAIFAFIHSWDELIVVIFIGGRALFTLPRRMWDGINDNLDPVIAVVATGMILFTSAGSHRGTVVEGTAGEKPATCLREDGTMSDVSRSPGRHRAVRRADRGQGLSAPRLPRHVRRHGPGTRRGQADAGAGRPERAGAGQLGRRRRARHEERLGRSLSQEVSRPEGRRSTAPAPRPAASA